MNVVDASGKKVKEIDPNFTQYIPAPDKRASEALNLIGVSAPKVNGEKAEVQPQQDIKKPGNENEPEAQHGETEETVQALLFLSKNDSPGPQAKPIVLPPLSSPTSSGGIPFPPLLSYFPGGVSSLDAKKRQRPWEEEASDSDVINIEQHKLKAAKSGENGEMDPSSLAKGFVSISPFGLQLFDAIQIYADTYRTIKISGLKNGEHSLAAYSAEGLRTPLKEKGCEIKKPYDNFFHNYTNTYQSRNCKSYSGGMEN